MEFQILQKSSSSTLSSMSKYLLLCLFAVLAIQKVFAIEAQEYEIKATYIYNFAKFIDWPEEKTNITPIVLCVMGKEPLRSSLDKLAKDKFVKKRPLQVRGLNSFNDIKSCHVVFIGEVEGKKQIEILKKINLEKILSVSDSLNFLDNGGHIQFFEEENKLKFEISLASLNQAGLKIDARVLNIAKIRR